MCPFPRARVSARARREPVWLERVGAAGDALVRAAGGSVTTLEGAPVRYNQWDSLKAPKFVAAGDSDINYLELIADPDP